MVFIASQSLLRVFCLLSFDLLLLHPVPADPEHGRQCLLGREQLRLPLRLLIAVSVLEASLKLGVIVRDVQQRWTLELGSVRALPVRISGTVHGRIKPFAVVNQIVVKRARSPLKVEIIRIGVQQFWQLVFRWLWTGKLRNLLNGLTRLGKFFLETGLWLSLLSLNA
uniref:(northern house mosquito) hypothetical protein n=1 Tax=Culex pipiens TaxID=7175 RepID=A0A8D8AXF7_CULPI